MQLLKENYRNFCRDEIDSIIGEISLLKLSKFSRLQKLAEQVKICSRAWWLLKI